MPVSPVFTKQELVLLRMALDEWRTVAPGIVQVDSTSLERWLEVRSLFDQERTTAEAKIGDYLSAVFDEEHEIIK